MSLWEVLCMPLSLKILLPRGLVARIQKRIFLGCTYGMGFDWQPCTLFSLMGGVLALRHLHPLGATLFCHFGILVGGLHSPPLLLLIIVGGLHSPPLILLATTGGIPSPLTCWDYGGHGRIVVSAAYLGGLCFFGHFSICHL